MLNTNLHAKSVCYLFILCIGFSIVFSSCSIMGKGKMAVTKSSKTIPPEFGDEPTTLLIQLNYSMQDREKMKKLVKEHYKGDFEFINMDERDSHKYSDTEKYRYIYYHEESISKVGSTAQFGPHVQNLASFLPMILDRKTELVYEYFISIDSIKLATKIYMKALSKELNT